MSFFKTLYLALFILVSTGLTTTAMAQSASAHDHDHDHATPEASEQSARGPVLEGTYTETQGDHVLGAETAPITMIIYASVTCPHCASWFNAVWPSLKTNYVNKNKLRVVFREFPTDPVNIAVIGFQIANCGPKDKYFEMIEHQMKEQDNIFSSLKAGTGKDTYLKIAKKAGLEDESAMNTCIQSEVGYNRINKSISLARAGNISSVPNFIINGKTFKGESDYLPLSKHLDDLLLQEFSPMLKP